MRSRLRTQAARNDFAADGRHRRSVSLGASEGASDPATPQEATSDETWEGEPGHEVVRAHSSGANCAVVIGAVDAGA